MSEASSARRDFEDSLQRTAHAPTRYPLGDMSEQVTYTNVLGDDQSAIGAIYVSASGGLSTLFFANSGETMTALMHELTELYGQGLSASEAYEQLTNKPELAYGEEDVAVLSSLLEPMTTPVTAASDAVIDLPDETSGPMPSNALLYVTEDDDGTVIDLVYSDEVDVYLRTPAAEWAPVGDTEPDPIDGRVIVDVDPSYVSAYDSARAQDDTITDADLEQYRSRVA